MTTTVHRGPSSLAIPSTQNSAPIIEFRCLYTHDLRRKSKRWQDGFLRFHTFNKRVMVYDVLRNFVGDMHWRESGELQDGDELELEKGILVQVGELVARIDQDLTGLFEKKIKGRQDRAAQSTDTSSPVRHGMSSPVMPAHQPVSNGRNPPIPTPMVQLLPKTLNTLLGTPRGPHGRAIIPAKSPFQQTHSAVEDGQREEERATKRRMLGNGFSSTPNQNVKRKPEEGASTNAQNEHSGVSSAVDKQARQSRYLQAASPSRPVARSKTIIDVDAHGSASVKRFQKPALAELRSLERTVKPHYEPFSRSSSPPVSTISYRATGSGSSNDASTSTGYPVVNEDEGLPAQPLRLVGHAPRKKLLCQAALPVDRSSRARAGPARKTYLEQPDELEDFNEAQQVRLETRQRRLRQQTKKDIPDRNNDQAAIPDLDPSRKEGLERSISLPMTSSFAQRKDDTQPKRIAQTPQSVQRKDGPYGFTRPTRPPPTLPPLSSDTLETMALTHGKMDSILLLPQPAKPKSPLRRTRSEIVPPTSNPTQTSLQKSHSQPQGQGEAPAQPTRAAQETIVDADGGDKGKVLGMKEAGRIDNDIGPWSREAFDLFDWRPPDRGGMQET
ncbi:MAG: hypothetical protein M1835_000225 [Candelina submexicana]|nr:MAG: hypothetical protein M1835_000225 [Candelina submexicana]